MKGAAMVKEKKAKINRWTMTLACSLIAVCMLGGASSNRALAQQGHTHLNGSQEDDLTFPQDDQMNTLIKVVRQATERFQDVTVAEAAGYSLQFGCVTGSDSGAMGMHFV